MGFPPGDYNMGRSLDNAFQAAEDFVMVFWNRLAQDNQRPPGVKGLQTLDDLTEFLQNGVEGLAKRAGVLPAQWASISRDPQAKDWLEEVVFKQLLVAIFEKNLPDALELKTTLSARFTRGSHKIIVDSAWALGQEIRQTMIFVQSHPDAIQAQKQLSDLGGQLMLATTPALEEYHQRFRSVGAPLTGQQSEIALPQSRRSPITQRDFPPVFPAFDPIVRPIAAPQPRLGTPLLIYGGHTSIVYTVAWAPDGRRLASGGMDGTVQVWDVATGQRLASYHGHPDWVKAVAWAPDGTRIASGGSEGTVQVWDPISGLQLVSLKGHDNLVEVVAWAPDGSRLAFGGNNGTVEVWDTAMRQRLASYLGRHFGGAETVAWSPDGGRLASGGWLDQMVEVWNAVTGQQLARYGGHMRGVNVVVWSPDGSRLASSGSEDKTVQVWSATTGQRLTNYQGHSDPVAAVTWAPDGRRLASGGGDKTVQVWDAATEQRLTTYQGHVGGVKAVAWAPDGRRIASGGVDGTVQVWSAGG